MPVSAAAQPLTADDTDLSPWWLRTVLIVLLMGFTVLIGITTLAYRNAPPIPVQVVDAQGASLFSGGDISEGQTVFLKYGLMANGSIWGHGGYLGPDYSAIALHRIGEDTAAAIAQEHFRCRWRRWRLRNWRPYAPKRRWSSKPTAMTPRAGCCNSLRRRLPRIAGRSATGPNTSAILRSTAGCGAT